MKGQVHTITRFYVIFFYIFRFSFMTMSLSCTKLRGAREYILATNLFISPSFCPSFHSFGHTIFRFLCIYCQIISKEWHKIGHSDLSRWVTLGRHRFPPYLKDQGKLWFYDKNIPWPFIFHPCICRSLFLFIHLFVHSTFGFLRICCHVIWKKWCKICHADICWWTLSLHAFIHLSNHPWIWVWVLLTNRLEERVYNLSCCCIHDSSTVIQSLSTTRVGSIWDFRWRYKLRSTILKIKCVENPQISISVSWTNESNRYTHEIWVLDLCLGPSALRMGKEMIQRKQIKGYKGLNMLVK